MSSHCYASQIVSDQQQGQQQRQAQQQQQQSSDTASIASSSTDISYLKEQAKSGSKTSSNGGTPAPASKKQVLRNQINMGF